MNGNEHDIDTFDLLALADGRLDEDPHHKREIEKAVARDPALAARVQAYREQTEALRWAYDPRLAEPVPHRLSAILARDRHTRHAPGLLQAAAAVILTIAAGGTGWMAGRMTERAPGNWMMQAVAQTGINDQEPVAQSSKTLAAANLVSTRLPVWLTRDMPATLEAPNLSTLGFTLTGRKTVEIAKSPALRLDYQGTGGRTFHLFLRSRWHEKTPGLQVTEKNGVTFAAWMEGPLASAVAGNMSRAQTIAVAEAVRDALRHPVARAVDRSQTPAGTDSGDATISGDSPALPEAAPTKARPISDTTVLKIPRTPG